MTQRLTIVPEAQTILDDRPTGTFSSPDGTTSNIAIATKWAARVHGSVYVHPYVFGASRGDLPTPYASNRDTAAKEHGTSLVRVLATDYSVQDYVRFPIAGVAGQWWGVFDTVVYTNGKHYLWAVTLDSTVTDLDGNRSALIEVDPATLAWTIRYRTATWLIGNAATADSTHYYISSGSRSAPSNNRWHGLVKISLSDWTATSKGYWVQANGTFGTGPQNDVTYFQNLQFHSLVEDGSYIYATFPGEEINNLPSFAFKIQKSDLAMQWATPCPQSTDDMAHNATHLFGGVETQHTATDYYTRVGKNVGAFAIRKSDGRYTELPRLGPEDVWTNNANTNVVSFSSLVRGGYLVDIKYPINRLYVIDTAGADSWSLTSDLSNIVLADCGFDMSNVKALRRYYFNTQTWNITAENHVGPNEFVVDSVGKLHSFCWPAPLPSTHEGVSSLIRYTIPGFAFSQPPSVQTLAAVSVDRDTRTATLKGDLTSIGGDAVSEMGFYYGITNPPSIKTTAVVAGGIFQKAVTSSQAGTLYYRAFAKNSLGETLGNVLTADLSVTLPTVTTGGANANKATNSALLEGVISSAGGGTITQRGFYLSKDTNPPVTKYVAPGTASGGFSLSMYGLEEGLYYYRAFSTNQQGEALGSVVQFDTRPEAGVLEGYVYQSGGVLPIAGAWVLVVSHANNQVLASTQTDAHGKYRVTGLTSGALVDRYVRYKAANGSVLSSTVHSYVSVP